MKAGLRNACVSSAVIATLYGPSALMARDLIWDPSQTKAATGSDGDGFWDNSSTIWVDKAAPGTNTTFLNTPTPDSATFGTTIATGVTGSPNPVAVNIANPIVVQNITLNNGVGGATYNIYDNGGSETLTLNGNIIKAGGIGNGEIFLTNPMVLGAGNHIVAMRDSPGTPPELAIRNSITGSGSLTVDNSLNYAGPVDDLQWGTLLLTKSNSYTGGTNLVRGRLEITNSGALGSGLVTVSDGGAFGVGVEGVPTSAIGDQTITSNFKITRSDYTSTLQYSRYQYAVAAINDGTNSIIDFNGVIDVASTDARVGAYTNIVNINTPVTSSTGNGTFVATGDTAGFLRLNTANPALATGGVGVAGDVELEFTNQNQIGGATAPIRMIGGYLHPIAGVMTSFGTHPINASTFRGGFDVDSGQTFTLDASLGNLGATGTGALKKRGLGTLNVNTPVTTNGGASFWDLGTVNVNANVTLNGWRLRTTTVNINSGALLNTGASFVSIGTDTTGTNGNPDSSTVIVSGGSKIIVGNTDFNVADNGRTTGALTITGVGSAVNVGTTGGNFEIGKNPGAQGTVLVTNGGSVTTGSEMWIGNNQGTGSLTLNGGGSITTNNWTSVGRQTGTGTLNIDSSTFTKQGGGNMYVGEGAGNRTSTMTLTGTAVLNVNTGEFWVGQDGGTGIATITDNAKMTVNSWLALGRQGAASYGRIELSGSASLIKQGGNFIAVGSGGTGILNQSGASSLTSNGTRIGEGSNGTYNISGGTGTFTGEFTLGNDANRVGTMNVNGGTVVLPNAVFGKNFTTTQVGTDTFVSGNGTGGGVLSLNGGVVTANSIAGGGGGGAKTINFNGGQLRAGSGGLFISGTGASATSTFGTFTGTGITGVVQAGGAKISSNGFDVTVSAPLTHDTALGATADGGLVKSGSGTLTLTAANTYTGLTTVTGGTLELAAVAQTPVLGTGAAGADIQTGGVLFDYTGSSPAATIRGLLASSFQAATTPGIMDTGTLRSTTATAKRGLGYKDTGTGVLVRAALFGDADLDGGVSINDFNALATNFGQATGKVWVDGDFDYDGGVSINDFNLLAGNFGQTIPASAEAWAGLIAFAAAHNDLAAFEAVTGVPEPTTIGLLAAGATLGLRRRRRTV